MTACILHLSVLRTRSSILWIVFASNTYRASPICWPTGSNNSDQEHGSSTDKIGAWPAGRTPLKRVVWTVVYAICIALDLTCRSRDGGT